MIEFTAIEFTTLDTLLLIGFGASAWLGTWLRRYWRIGAGICFAAATVCIAVFMLHNLFQSAVLFPSS